MSIYIHALYSFNMFIYEYFSYFVVCFCSRIHDFLSESRSVRPLVFNTFQLHIWCKQPIVLSDTLLFIFKNNDLFDKNSIIKIETFGFLYEF